MSNATTSTISKLHKPYDPVPARAALAAKFATSEEKSAYYSRMGKKDLDQRVTLSGEEKQALAEAYALLGRVVARQPGKFNIDNQNDNGGEADDTDA